MKRLSVVLCLVIIVGMGHAAALAQDKLIGIDGLKKELDLLKRENELLKRENELLKKEIASLKKGSGTKPSEKDTESALSATVDNVEYVYQGTVRNGADVLITLLATSKKGDQAGPNGEMTLIDEDGDKYIGPPSGGFGARPSLREGVPVKLVWRFGPNPLTGKSSAPSPKITRFASLSVEPTVGRGISSIEFRNVPAVVTKSKAK